MKFLKQLKLFYRMATMSRAESAAGSQLPYKLSLSLTNECDCKCRNCHVWETYAKAPELKKGELSTEEIDRLFKSNGKDLFWVAFTGGEPFLRPDLVEIIKSCVTHCPNLLLLSIVTTGYATDRIPDITAEILKIAPKLTIYITVSIDGEERTHERNRRMKGGYARSVQTIKRLDELSKAHRNLKVRIETVVSHQNLDQLDGFLRSELIQSHETCFAFAQESERYFNQGTGVALQKSDAKKIAEVLRLVLGHARGHSLEKLMLKMYYRLSARFFGSPQQQVIPCYSGFASVFVGPYGEVRPCVMMPIVGKLQQFDFDLKALLQADAMKKARRTIVEDGCPNCWTPCEAMQTMGQNFGLALYRSLRPAKREPSPGTPLSPAPAGPIDRRV